MTCGGYGLQVTIDPAVFAMQPIGDRLLVRTRRWPDGTFACALSPPLWAGGEPVEPPPVSEWATGLYGPDGLLITAAGEPC